MRYKLTAINLLLVLLLSSCSTPQPVSSYPDRPTFAIGVDDPLVLMSTALTPTGSSTSRPTSAATTGVSSRSATNSSTMKGQ